MSFMAKAITAFVVGGIMQAVSPYMTPDQAGAFRTVVEMLITAVTTGAFVFLVPNKAR